MTFLGKFLQLLTYDAPNVPQVVRKLNKTT